jgi:hypothetical protein
MKTLRWVAFLAFAALPGCDQASPTTPEASPLSDDLSAAMTTAHTETVALQGGQDDPYAADHNGNGRVCSAQGGEGPYIDDVVPPRRIVVRMKPPPNPPPVQRFPCVSPAYPVAVFLDGS